MPHPDRAETAEIIVKVGGEGGSPTLVGMKAADGPSHAEGVASLAWENLSVAQGAEASMARARGAGKRIVRLGLSHDVQEVRSAY